MTEKEKILEYLMKTQQPGNTRNRMGCLESWYNSYFAMKQTFTYEEIYSMSENEIANLLKLAENIQEALYWGNIMKLYNCPDCTHTEDTCENCSRYLFSNIEYKEINKPYIPTPALADNIAWLKGTV